MSTYWKICCLDCNQQHGVEGFNHGEEILAAVIRDRNVFELLADSGTSYDLKSFDGVLIYPDFFLRHRNHVLVPVSEYGDIFGICKGEGDARCTLRDHHEGPHEKQRTVGGDYLLDVANNLRGGGKRCIVKDCTNRQTQGAFVGDLCAPCHDYLRGNDKATSQAYRNAMAHALQIGISRIETSDPLTAPSTEWVDSDDVRRYLTKVLMP
jgi:hypothetical protein